MTLFHAGEEPVRWLISMGERNFNNYNDSEDMNIQSYAMIDLPPYSDTLADEIRSFMDRNSDQDENSINDNVTKRKGNLDVILITNGQCIHYDKSPGVYVTRKSDLKKWTTAFPNAHIIM